LSLSDAMQICVAVRDKVDFLHLSVWDAFLPSQAEDEATRRKHAALWITGLVASVLLAVVAAGALQGALPPLAAVALVLLLRGVVPRDPARRMGGGAVIVLAAGVTLFVVRAVVADAAGYSAWLGGAPRGGDPPTFDAALELVFHAFAPWSALVLVALVRMLAPPPSAEVPTDGPDEGAEDGAKGEAARLRMRRRALGDARLSLVLWAALGYGALTVYTARYGPGTFLPLVALAAAVAVLLRDVELSERAWWPEAVIGILFVGLIVRDFGLYPASPIHALPLEGLETPEVFDPRKGWAIVMGLFGVAIGLALGSAPTGEPPDLRAPYRWLRDQWVRGGAQRTWLILASLVVGGAGAFGAVCWVAGDSLPLASIAIRVGKKLVLLPVVIPVAVAAVPLAFQVVRRMGHFRMVPVLLAGAVVGGWAAHGYIPQLSSHFSPREVYDSYNELHGEGEPLAEYRVSGRAAAYYAEGETRDLESQSELLAYLAEEGRRWAVIPADELASVNRAYRQDAGEHLFVADARSARVLLVTNRPIEGRENQNFIAGAVLDEEPNPEHRVGGLFDERIELIGYDLETPQPGYVGAGQSFTVTWYWRARQRVPGSYKIFLHIDGQGNRMNGDHDPVEGRYPVRLWDQGDIVVDRQTLTVPANYRPGRYTFFIGFYAGSNRLAVTPEDMDDGDDRLRAGHVVVR
ncbi:MAG TPA: hypothetical protein RMG95_00215, partial [Polyangiaceae bacterium LLY-WYZ-15_(1-7)]|nr:hypothetical protein [Polyangiaceae bacterium LLY-WYZ-15_(1-7)]